MATKDNDQEYQRLFDDAEEKTTQNHRTDRDNEKGDKNNISKENLGKPVNNGGVSISKSDIPLEKQWLAVRDEYLSHYPDIKDIDTESEKGNFTGVIENIAKRRNRTSKEIRDEIMEWTLTENR